jgi:CheY-like chemotaxis protein
MILKVLLIEDDTTMLTLLRTLLRFEGYEVAQMEGDGHLDGIVEAIRKDKELQDIRVIMSSGIDFSQKCLEEGVDGFIQKPYMPEELIRKIRELHGG